jgi:hypothetical protein
MCFKELGWEGVDWIHRDKDRDNWRALVKTAMNLRVPKNAEQLSDCQQVVRSMNLLRPTPSSDTNCITYNAVVPKLFRFTAPKIRT